MGNNSTPLGSLVGLEHGILDSDEHACTQNRGTNKFDDVFSVDMMTSGMRSRPSKHRSSI